MTPRDHTLATPLPRPFLLFYCSYCSLRQWIYCSLLSTNQNTPSSSAILFLKVLISLILSCCYAVVRGHRYNRQFDTTYDRHVFSEIPAFWLDKLETAYKRYINDKNCYAWKSTTEYRIKYQAKVSLIRLPFSFQMSPHGLPGNYFKGSYDKKCNVNQKPDFLIKMLGLWRCSVKKCLVLKGLTHIHWK